MSRAEKGVLAAAAALLAITAGWWAFALWPVPGETPEWLARARNVCFGATESGLPDAGGWILLVGQPLGMFGLLAVGWTRTLRSGLAGLWSRGAGRAGLVATALAVVAGLGLAGARVAAAASPGFAAALNAPPAAAGAPEGSAHPAAVGGTVAGAGSTLERPAPGAALVDQSGGRVSVADFRGRPLLVTFAFGHCETVCPLVVERARRAAERLESLEPAVLVVTLDPWRDTPGRLAHIAGQWGLDAPGLDARVLSGSVEEVEAALDAWDVPRSRDLRTGDIVHPALLYVVDRGGTVRWSGTGDPDAVVAAVESL